MFYGPAARRFAAARELFNKFRFNLFLKSASIRRSFEELAPLLERLRKGKNGGKVGRKERKRIIRIVVRNRIDNRLLVY